MKKRFGRRIDERHATDAEVMRHHSRLQVRYSLPPRNWHRLWKYHRDDALERGCLPRDDQAEERPSRKDQIGTDLAKKSKGHRQV